jgi:hypothetical protein
MESSHESQGAVVQSVHPLIGAAERQEDPAMTQTQKRRALPRCYAAGCKHPIVKQTKDGLSWCALHNAMLLQLARSLASAPATVLPSSDHYGSGGRMLAKS